MMSYIMNNVFQSIFSSDTNDDPYDKLNIEGL